jgi:hypothetical protein
MSPVCIKLAIVCWWNQNLEIIAAEQCENRFDITIMCSGKCVLVKTIDKYNDHERESNNGQIFHLLTMGIDNFDLYPHGLSFQDLSIGSSRVDIIYTASYFNSSFINSLIKPPIV